MRKAVWRSDAIRYTILVIGFIFILTIYPFRFWQRTITESDGGEPAEASMPVNDRGDLIQEFIAQYDRLGAINIRIEEQVSGRYVRLSLFDDKREELYFRYVDIEGETIPGMVRIPVGIPLEVGREYRLLFVGTHAEMIMGLQDPPDGDDAFPYFTSLFTHDELQPDRHLNMTLEYEQPIDRTTSILLILGIAAVAVLLERLVWFVAKRRGRDKDRIITVGTMIRMVAIPLWLAFILGLLVMLVMQKFDWRPVDNIFYGLGLVLAGVVGSALIVHVTEMPERENKNIITTVIEVAQVFAFAMAVQGACDYMNGLFDDVHRVAEQKEIIWLAVFLLLFLVGGRKPEEKDKKSLRINLFGILPVLFFVLLVIFRNGRSWAVTLAIFFAAALLCWRFSRRRDRWLPLFTWGLILQFSWSLGYCYLHRYFVGFVSARFSFIFHTVTVTAEYLTMIGGAAFALLFAAVMRIPKGTGVRDTIRAILPQGVLFGLTGAYILFTASRTGILAMIVMVLLLLVVAGRKGHRIASALRGAVVAVCSLVIMFPPAFTLQRLLPPMIARPEYMMIEDAVSSLRGATAWNNTMLMSVERFVPVFLEKVAGFEPVSYPYPEDWYNYDADGNEIYPPMGLSEEEMATRRFYEELLKARQEYEASLDGSSEENTEEETGTETQAVAVAEQGGARQETTVVQQGADAQAGTESSADAQEGVQEAEEGSEEGGSSSSGGKKFVVNGKEYDADDLYDFYIPDVDDQHEAEAFTVEKMSNGRMTLWRSYLPALNLTGHEGMGVELPDGEIAVHAHNVYLQVAYDNGYIVGGLFVLMILMAVITGTVYGNKESSDEKMRGYALVPLALTLGFAAAGLTEWNFHFSNMMTLTMIFSWIPLCFRSVSKKSSEQAEVKD